MQKVNEIFSLKLKGLFGTEIAKLIGVSTSAVSSVLMGYSWESVERPDSIRLEAEKKRSKRKRIPKEFYRVKVRK